MNEINGFLPLKPSSVGDPDIYLGAKLKQTRLPNGAMAWGLSPSKYIIQAVKICQLHLTKKNYGKYLIPARVDNPFPVDYDLSTDLSDVLDPECFYSTSTLLVLGCDFFDSKTNTQICKRTLRNIFFR